MPAPWEVVKGELHLIMEIPRVDDLLFLKFPQHRPVLANLKRGEINLLAPPSGDAYKTINPGPETRRGDRGEGGEGERREGWRP